MTGYTQRECRSEHCGCKVSHSQEYENGGWFWKCYNCGKLTPIQTRKAVVQNNGMTKAQEKAVEMLRVKLLGVYIDDPTKNEYKEFEVTVYDGFVSLLAVVGLKGDEGTMASIICRDRRHIYIGLKGGLTLANAKDPKESKGLFNVLYSARSY